MTANIYGILPAANIKYLFPSRIKKGKNLSGRTVITEADSVCKGSRRPKVYGGGF